MWRKLPKLVVSPRVCYGNAHLSTNIGQTVVAQQSLSPLSIGRMFHEYTPYDLLSATCSYMLKLHL